MQPPPPLANTGPANRSPTMVAIYTILAFLVVIFSLNYFEFGRFD
ncbi:hypothetical protein [Phenylobacterium sp.]|nr:hypothetical protein [Phenylobacterium sp.]